MKDKILFFTLFIIGLAFYSCDNDDIKNENNYEKSYKAWIEFKKQSNNSYAYTTVAGTWVGAAWETTITVENGVITQRHFKYTRVNDNLTPPAVMEWTENKDEINTCTDSPAWKAMTLDEIYAMAKEDWLLDRDDATITFDTDNNGMISSCGYTPDGCADDCFRGIRIKEIKSLK